MTITAEAKADPRLSLRALLSDPWVVTAVVWLVVILVAPDDGTMPSIVEALIHDYISTTLFFVLAIGSLWLGTGQSASRREKRFWHFELSASIGIATSCKTGRDPSELIEAADRAMYAIKRSGGGAAGAE